MSDKTQLLISEYEAHQARYRQLTTQQVWLQNYTLIFSAAIWAWALGAKSPSMSKVVLGLPSLMSVLFLAKAIFLHFVATDLHKRLGKIEELLGATCVGFYSSGSEISGDDARQTPQHFIFRYWLWFYWSLILLANLIALVLGMAYSQTIWGGINCK